MIIFQTVLILVMIAAAVLAVRSRDLMNAVIACALVSLIASIIFYFLHAPDVAMAEAAMGKPRWSWSQMPKLVKLRSSRLG